MTTGNTEPAALELPQPILDRLNKAIRRIRRIMFLRGTLAVAAVALGAILAIMAIDAATMIFSTAVRWGMTLAALGGVIATAYGFLFRPLAKKWNPQRVARLLETRHPEMQERISSAIELLSMSGPGTYRGSERLLARLVEEAGADVGHISPNKEFTMRTAKPYQIAVATAAAILVLLFALSPATTTRLFARAVIPSLRLGNAYAGMMRVTPEDVTIPEGDPVRIEARVSNGRVLRAELRSELADGTKAVERMQREETDGGSLFSITIPSVTESFRYRVRAGQALSGFCRVNVVPRPAVEHLHVTRFHPAYTGREPDCEEVTEVDRIHVLAGTDVEVAAELNKPVQTVNLIKRNEAVPGGKTTQKQDRPIRSWRFGVGTTGESASLLVRLTDDYGFENRPRRRELVVVRDEAPSIEIVEPAELKLRMRPTDLLPILYTAGDDFGIAKVKMLIRLNGKQAETRDVPEPVRRAPSPGGNGEPGESERPSWLGRAVLDLTSLQLARARTVSVQLAVADNLPAERKGPQQAHSKTISITIDRRAKSLAQQTIRAQEAAIHKALDNTEKRLREAKRHAEKGMKAPLKRHNEMTAAVRKAADAVQKHAATAEAAMNELSEDVRDTAFDKLADKIQETAQEDIAPARETAELMQLTEKPKDPAAMTDKINTELDEALAAVQELKKDIEDTSKQANYLADLADLAEKERRLAEEAAAAAASTEQEIPENWQKQQQSLADQLARLANENPEALGQSLAEQLEKARQVAQEARALASKQEKARQAEDAISDPGKHGAVEDKLREIQDPAAEANLDEHLAQAQRGIDREAERIAEQAQALNEMGRNAAMTPQAREAMKEAAESLAQAQRHTDSAADQLEKRTQPEAETPGEAKRALEQAAQEAHRRAARQAQQAAQEKREANKAHQAAEAARREAHKAEQKALAADAAHKKEAQQAAQQAKQDAQQAQQEAAGEMRAAANAEAQAARAAEQARQADQAIEAVEREQTAAKQAMEGAARMLEQMGEELTAQLRNLEALQAQWEAAELQQAAMDAQQQAQEAQAQAEAVQQHAQELAAAQPSSQEADHAAQEARQAQAEAGEQQHAAEAAQQAAHAAQQHAHEASESHHAAHAAQQQAHAAQQQAQQAQQQAAQSQQSAQQAQQNAHPGAASQQQARQSQQAAQQSQQAAQQAQQNALAAQQQAAQALAQAAIPMRNQRAEQVGDMLDGQQMAQAVQTAQQAAQPPSAPTPAQAARQQAQAAQQAAQQMEALAQQAAQNMGMPSSQMAQALAQSNQNNQSDPQSANPDGKGNQSMQDWQGIPAPLESLGISMADWIRISGWLRSDVAAEGQKDIHPEYRELVKRYFREVARRSGTVME